MGREQNTEADVNIGCVTVSDLFFTSALQVEGMRSVVNDSVSLTKNICAEQPIDRWISTKDYPCIDFSEVITSDTNFATTKWSDLYRGHITIIECWVRAYPAIFASILSPLKPKTFCTLFVERTVGSARIDHQIDWFIVNSSGYAQVTRRRDMEIESTVSVSLQNGSECCLGSLELTGEIPQLQGLTQPCLRIIPHKETERAPA